MYLGCWKENLWWSWSVVSDFLPDQQLRDFKTQRRTCQFADANWEREKYLGKHIERCETDGGK